MSSREEEKNQRREARIAAEEAARRVAFPDTGPQADGTRTKEQWQNAIDEDMRLAKGYLVEALDSTRSLTKEDRALQLALAQKETYRMLSDIRRVGEEILGISKKDLDNVGPL